MRLTAMTAALMGALVVLPLAATAQAVQTKQLTTADSLAATGGTGTGRGKGATGSVTKSWVDTGSKLPSLDANANAVLIQHIHVEQEGFAVDTPAKPAGPGTKVPGTAVYRGPVPLVTPTKDTARKRRISN